MTKSAAFPGLILFAVALLSGHLRTNIAAVTSIIHPFLLSSLPLDHFQPYLADWEAAASKRRTRSTRAAAAAAAQAEAAARGQGVVSRVSSARSDGLATSRVLLCSDRQLREEETDRAGLYWAELKSIGCVNPASWLPLATGSEFTQPRGHSFAQPCKVLFCSRLLEIFRFSMQTEVVGTKLKVV